MPGQLKQFGKRKLHWFHRLLGLRKWTDNVRGMCRGLDKAHTRIDKLEKRINRKLEKLNKRMDNLKRCEEEIWKRIQGQQGDPDITIAGPQGPIITIDPPDDKNDDEPDTGVMC